MGVTSLFLQFTPAAQPDARTAICDEPGRPHRVDFVVRYRLESAALVERLQYDAC